MVDTQADDILKAIAQRYLGIGCAVMTPNSIRLSNIEKLIAEYDVDGVVELDLQSCTPYTVEAYTLRKLMERLFVQYIAIETDYSQSDSGRLLTRLEAFLEML